MRVLLFFLFGIVAVSKCLAGADTTNAIPMRSLAKGALSGITAATQQVITNQSRWEEIWKQHNVRSRSEQREAPKVDFKNEIVLVATLGLKTTGGFGIEIVRTEIFGGKLRVFIRKKNPPPGAMTVQALTAPFHFAAVLKSDLPVEWVF